MPPEIYKIKIAEVERHLPLVEVTPGLSIAILDILGDTELIQEAASALAEKLNTEEFDVFVTAEAKSIPLIFQIGVETKKPWVVLRKSEKTYMGNTISAETTSITTGQPQVLYLRERDIVLIDGMKVCLIDDVISTGSTQNAMRAVVEKAEGEVIVEAAILTEGDREKWAHIISLGHLPVWTE